MNNELFPIFIIIVGAGLIAIAIITLIIFGIMRIRIPRGSMKMYEVYTSPVGGIEAVKKGWSWPGFFFTWIWAFVKGLYGLGAAILIVGIIFNLHPVSGIIFDIITILWFGSNGNETRKQNLRKRGYEFVLLLSAETPEGAIALFVQEQKSSKQEHTAETQASNAHESQPPDNTSKLVNCPECNKAVSRKAASCPNCGSPIGSV